MSEYIPYSIRNNIKDPNLAGLLDYIDRETELNIVFERENTYSFKTDRYVVRIDTEVMAYGVLNREEDGTIFMLTPEIFLRTYKTLLPVTRDLYSK